MTDAKAMTDDNEAIQQLAQETSARWTRRGLSGWCAKRGQKRIQTVANKDKASALTAPAFQSGSSVTRRA